MNNVNFPDNKFVATNHRKQFWRAKRARNGRMHHSQSMYKFGFEKKKCIGLVNTIHYLHFALISME